jgi:hypothetical protein
LILFKVWVHFFKSDERSKIISEFFIIIIIIILILILTGGKDWFNGWLWLLCQYYRIIVILYSLYAKLLFPSYPPNMTLLKSSLDQSSIIILKVMSHLENKREIKVLHIVLLYRIRVYEIKMWFLALLFMDQINVKYRIKIPRTSILLCWRSKVNSPFD